VKKPAAIIFIFIVFTQEKDSFIPSPCDTALGVSLQPILFRLGSDESQKGAPLKRCASIQPTHLAKQACATHTYRSFLYAAPPSLVRQK